MDFITGTAQPSRFLSVSGVPYLMPFAGGFSYHLPFCSMGRMGQST